MKTFYASLLVVFCLTLSVSAQGFDPNIETDWITDEIIVPESPLKYQVIFVGGTDEVQTLDANGNPNGTALAKQWHDFIGFTPDEGSSDLGWLSVNHEMIEANDKIGDGGGMTVFKIRRNANDEIEVVDQTISDGRSGKFFNVDFTNTVGETGMNCGGIQSQADGRIWTAEEWFRSSNSSIYADGDGVRDTSDFTISTDIPGNFDGSSIKRYQNFNYMVEIDPREAKALRKQYNWGRQPFEGGTILPDNQTVFLGADATPGFMTKFIADTPGDFTQGTTYVYKQNDGAYTGVWVEIDNSSLDNMLNFADRAVAVGATMFNRLEWVAYDPIGGKVYFTETGRDNPGSRWADEAGEGATLAQHHKDRAADQGGVDPFGGDYWDYYGRVLQLDPATDEVTNFLEAGPFYAGLDADEPKYEPYPDKHLSNPDGLNFLVVNGKSFMIILEDLNGTSYGRVPIGIANRTCEMYLLDMQDDPKIDNLVRIGSVPLGAEVTGACPTPDGKTIFVNSQHPLPTNPFPYNNSLTFAISGWDQVITSVAERDDDNNSPDGFQVFPNPAFRVIKFNKVVDVALYDAQGKIVRSYKQADRIDVSNLTSGYYFIKTADGESKKVVIK